MATGAVEANPVIKVPRNVEKERERVLSDDELKAIWRTTESDIDFSYIVRLLMLTGTRRGEVGSMQWSEIQDNLGRYRASARRTDCRMKFRLQSLCFKLCQNSRYLFLLWRKSTPLVQSLRNKAQSLYLAGARTLAFRAGRRPRPGSTRSSASTTGACTI